MLKPKLPMLIRSLGISLAIIIIKERTVDISKVLKLGLTIFSVTSVLNTYAPKISPFTSQGFGFSSGMMMVGGGGQGDCKCNNPYSNESILKVVQDQIDVLPARAKALLSVHPQSKMLLKPALVNKIERKGDPTLPHSTGAAPEIISEPAPINIQQINNKARNTVVDPNKMSVRDALIRAGFDPKWTMGDVKKMQKSAQGKQALLDINNMVRELTGISTLTNGDIISAFPHYYTDYICRLTVQGGKQGKQGKGQEVQTQTASQIASQIPKTKKMPTAKIDNTNLFPGSMKHCHWDTMKKDLDSSIVKLFEETVDPVEQQHMITTMYYLQQRAELEVRSLINMFHSKNKIDWLNFFKSSVEREPRGFHIEGTTYFIPWDFFRKYDVCFGGLKI